MTCLWVMAAMTRTRPRCSPTAALLQRSQRRSSWENVRLSSSDQDMVDIGAAASCLGSFFERLRCVATRTTLVRSLAFAAKRPQ